MLVKYIRKLTKGENLTFDEAKEAMDAVLDGGATPVQISAYLTALRMKGETIEEISGSAAMMNSKAIGITPNVSNYVDCVGTGGDGTNTFNTVSYTHLDVYKRQVVVHHVYCLSDGVVKRLGV